MVSKVQIRAATKLLLFVAVIRKPRKFILFLGLQNHLIKKSYAIVHSLIKRHTHPENLVHTSFTCGKSRAWLTHAKDHSQFWVHSMHESLQVSATPGVQGEVAR
jgi:hypothetical protein